MRVLFVTPSLPWPLDQGARIRASELIAALPREVELDLWWVARPGEPELPARLRQRCRAVRRFERSEPWWLERLAWPRAARWFHSGELAAALAGELPDVDLVHLDEPSLVPHWPRSSRTPATLQHHKLESVLADAMADAAAREGASQTALRLDAERWRRLESEAAARIPAQFVCAAEDADRLCTRFSQLDPLVVENGVDPAYFAPRETRRDPNRLVFLGSLDYEPNRDGLRGFLREVWPALREARPSLRIALVGRGSAPELQATSAFEPRVEWVGAVPDVRPQLASCGALVVPLRIGGGTRIKITSALAMRTPVVSTAVGAEGLALLPGVHLRTAELGPAFATATLATLDAGPHDPVTAAGHEYVLAHYTWTQLAARLVTGWRACLASGGRTTTA